MAQDREDETGPRSQAEIDACQSDGSITKHLIEGIKCLAVDWLRDIEGNEAVEMNSYSCYVRSG